MDYLFLRVLVLGHPATSHKMCRHLIHRLPARYCLTLNAGANFDPRIIVFHFVRFSVRIDFSLLHQIDTSFWISTSTLWSRLTLSILMRMRFSEELALVWESNPAWTWSGRRRC